jgi:hypothetical protein
MDIASIVVIAAIVAVRVGWRVFRTPRRSEG